MTSLEWRPELLLNVAEIDSQHREIVDCASRLHAAISEGQAQEQIRPMLSALIELTEMHFTSEEAMMLAHGFDGHAAHRSEHQKLLKQIYLVDKDISSGRIHLCQTLELFVQVWIEQHILSSDRQFAEFLKSKGVD
jgi:hemerythrin-like metal-binding protein